jgi:L-threonylcarbamoyladenylate synthase
MSSLYKCTSKNIENAATALKNGYLVSFPTETVYGLGADPLNKKAISNIYRVKSRPTDHPLIVHISSSQNLEKWAQNIPNYAFLLAENFWPGPMTLILQRTNLAKNYITGGQDKVGIRVPNQKTALYLLKKFELIGGLGIAAPSANKFGAVSATSAEDVLDEIGDRLSLNDIVLNGGKCKVGLESTIIDCTSNTPSVLRPGAITIEMIEKITGIPIRLSSNKKIKVSGKFESHYSPKAKIFIGDNAKPGDGFMALRTHPTPNGAIRLARPKDVDEFASQLYKSFRDADKRKIKNLFILMPEGTGLAAAVKDRVLKASKKT